MDAAICLLEWLFLLWSRLIGIWWRFFRTCLKRLILGSTIGLGRLRINFGRLRRDRGYFDNRILDGF